MIFGVDTRRRRRMFSPRAVHSFIKATKILLGDISVVSLHHHSVDLVFGTSFDGLGGMHCGAFLHMINGKKAALEATNEMVQTRRRYLG